MVLEKTRANDIYQVTTVFIEAIGIIRRDRAIRSAANKLKADVARIFRLQRKAFMREFVKAQGLFSEAVPGDRLKRIVGSKEAMTNDEFRLALKRGTELALVSGASHRLDELKVGISFDLANPRAVTYLEQNAALKVTQINEHTRKVMARIVTQGTEEGWSYNKTAKAITNKFSEFSIGKPQKHIRSRAHLVAVTESAQAYEEGNKQAVKMVTEQGLLMEKMWQTVGDDLVTEECDANQGAGWIAYEEVFPSGDESPPRFPGCRCTALYRRKPD